ncbi:MAG: hypothetical protein Q8P50_11945 [Bacillota bacterium]|nr:hypothetical protein [Bacillota bacterium]
MPPGWIIQAPSACVLFIGDEMRISALLMRSLTHTEHAQPILEFVARLAPRFGDRKASAAARRLAGEAPFLEDWARELRESDYAVLNAHSLVSIWGAVETCVEDLAVSVFLNWPHALPALQLIGVKHSLQFPPSEEQAHALYGKLERRMAAPGDIVETYAGVLGHLELDAPVSASDAAILREVNALRNCLLHRGGRIDARAVQAAPTLAGQEGSAVRVSSADYLRYHEAVSAWVVALLSSATQSKYFPR